MSGKVEVKRRSTKEEEGELQAQLMWKQAADVANATAAEEERQRLVALELERQAELLRAEATETAEETVDQVHLAKECGP